jgi:hypothetical protein
MLPSLWMAMVGGHDQEESPESSVIETVLKMFEA